jgi:hypothetical protein
MANSEDIRIAIQKKLLAIIISAAHNAALKTLAEHIAQQLKERGFCIVFDCDLERCWPSRRMARTERERKIQELAESQGWTAAILDAGFGTRVILRKHEPGIDAASIYSVSDERLRKRDAA